MSSKSMDLSFQCPSSFMEALNYMIFKITCSSRYITNESGRIVTMRTEKRESNRGRRSYLIEMGQFVIQESSKNSSNRGRIGRGGRVKAAETVVIVVVAIGGYPPCAMHCFRWYIITVHIFFFLEGIPIFLELGLLLTTNYFYADLWHLR